MMNQEDIFKKIGQILNELNEQYQYLAQNPEELNELELELFLANSTFLSDHVQIVRKLNSKSSQKALPEHAASAQETIVQEPVIPVKIVDEHANAEEARPVKPVIEEEIFKIDKEPSTFEFILNDKPSSDKFEFEEKSIDEIFDRPLSEEETQIIAQKQKLRELDSLESELPEEDEIGPEPFLVSEPLTAPEIGTEPSEEDESNEDEQGITEEQEDNEAAYIDEACDEEQGSSEEVSFKPEPFTAVDEAESLHAPETEKSPDILNPVPAEEMNSSEEHKPEEVPVSAAIPDKPFIQDQPAIVQIPHETDNVEPVKQNELFSPAATAPSWSQPVASPSAPEEQPKAKPTLNDILSGNAGGTNNFISGAGRMSVTDLKQAISLNDKMRYIKDLFNGYNLAYAEAIDLLNKMPDFKTADAFLQNNYAVKNNWSSKQDTVDQFYELLNQRFPAK